MEGWVLTFVKDGKVTKLGEYTMIQNLQRERAKLKQDPKYKSGKLQVRTIEGFKAKKIL